MGSLGTSGSTQQTSQSGQQTVTPNPMLTQEEQLQLEQQQAFQPEALELNQNAGQDINTLLTGGNLPGNLSQVSTGIDQNTINNLTNQSLQELYPQFQAGGIMNSGTAASVAGQTAGSIATNAQQFNIQNLLQLMNLAVGGQASVQGTSNSTANSLSNSLSGLNTINTTGNYSGSGTQTSSFLQDLSMGGQAMGGAGLMMSGIAAI